MHKLEVRTLTAVSRQMAAHPWPEAEIAGLVDTGHGVISGLQQLLDDLEALRRVDLGMVPPAQDIHRIGTLDAAD